MDEVTVAALLRDASAEVAVHDPPAEEIIRAGRRRTAWRRAGGGALALVVAAGIAAAVVVPRSDQAPEVVPAVGAGCPDRLVPALLPVWARAGFTDPEPRMPYVASGSGQLVAILFTDGLYAPPKADQANKILWVTPIPNTPAGPLKISAQRDGTSQVVAREVPGGPGPSTVDLPGPGCWHLTLHWGGAADTIDLRYLSP